MQNFREPLQLGRLTLPNRVFLAPLAGVSDVPFRRICSELGAGLTFVEMLSCVPIKYRAKRTMEMCVRHPSETVLGVQVTGPTAEGVGEAVKFLDGLPFDVIDLNMGCSVRKVVGGGAGSGILSEPDRINETVRRAREATGKVLSVKTRLGLSPEQITVEDTAGRIAQEGADMLTLHGRTRCDKYSTPVDLAGIRLGLQAATDPSGRRLVGVGNGNLFSYDNAAQMRAETGCDAVMVSRGALGNPWIFREILEGQVAHPTLEEWMDVVLRHLDYQQAHYGDTELAAIIMRKHLLWYIRGFPRGKSWCNELGLVKSIEEAKNVVRAYASQCPSDTVRFASVHHAPDRFGSHSKYDPKYDMDREHDRGVETDDVSFLSLSEEPGK